MEREGEGGGIGVSGYIRLDSIMAAIHYYLERENYKVLEFLMTNFSYFKISAPFFLHHPRTNPP